MKAGQRLGRGIDLESGEAGQSAAGGRGLLQASSEEGASVCCLCTAAAHPPVAACHHTSINVQDLCCTLLRCVANTSQACLEEDTCALANLRPSLCTASALLDLSTQCIASGRSLSSFDADVHWMFTMSRLSQISDVESNHVAGPTAPSINSFKVRPCDHIVCSALRWYVPLTKFSTLARCQVKSGCTCQITWCDSPARLA